MAYKWKPSKTTRRAFAEKMQDPAERQAYEQRKADRAEKRRAGSSFDYVTAGGEYVPTRAQYHAASDLMYHEDREIQRAAIIVAQAWLNNDKCHHDFIHVVNEYIRRGDK